MIKINRTLVTVSAIVLALCSFTGCGAGKDSDDNGGANTGKNGFFGIGETKYAAEGNFFYSADKGHSYGNGTKEYEIGDTVYMKVKFKVTSNKNKISQVKVVLTIPSIDNVDAKYMDGQIITPNFDAVNNVTTYEFTANASETAVDQECVIQFIPNAVGEIPMTLVFDDNVDPSYDKQSTLVFIESEPEATSTTATTTTTTTTAIKTTTSSNSEDTTSEFSEETISITAIAVEIATSSTDDTEEQ